MKHYLVRYKIENKLYSAVIFKYYQTFCIFIHKFIPSSTQIHTHTLTIKVYTLLIQ